MKSIIKFALIGALATSFPAVAAAAYELQEGTAKIEQSQDTLATIKDDTSLSPEERVEKEINARYDIVLNALTLSLTEVDSIRANLAKLPQFSEGSLEKELQAQFFLELDGFSKYYSDKLEQLKKAPKPTLEKIKATAQEIITYRETTYNLAIKKIIDFTLFFYGNEVIATANSRLGKISSDITRLEKLNLLKVDLFKANLDQVALLINGAASLQRQAGELILSVPKNPSDAATDSVASGTGIAPTEVAVTPDANTLIRESLGKIRSAYEIFLQISKDIRTALGF